MITNNRCTHLLLPPALNVAFRFFEPQNAKSFPNEKLLRKEKIAATEGTIFHLGNGSAIQGSKDLNAMFNVGGKSN